MIYDFYFTTWIFDHKTQLHSNQNVDASAKEAALAIISEFKKIIINDVYFAVCSELAHLFDKNKTLSNDFAQSYQEKLKNKDHIDIRHDSYQSINELGLSPENVISNAKALFEQEDLWNKNYGGEAWAKICEGWLKLKQSDDKNTIAWIDHMIDLEHNTGTVFNKLDSWKINGKHNWIKPVLDHKAKITSPWELLRYCSPDIQQLGAAVLKYTKNQTKDQNGTEGIGIADATITEIKAIEDSTPLPPGVFASAEEEVMNNDTKYISESYSMTFDIGNKSVDQQQVQEAVDPFLESAGFCVNVIRIHKGILSVFIIDGDGTINETLEQYSYIRKFLSTIDYTGIYNAILAVAETTPAPPAAPPATPPATPPQPISHQNV